jgi:hypothetical protein
MSIELKKENIDYYFTKPLTLSFIINLGFLVFIFYFSDYDFSKTLKTFAIILVVQSILYYIPLVLFYYNYRNKSKGKKFQILDNYRFCYIKNGEKRYFTNSEIEKVVYHLSIPLKINNPIILSWHDYYFIKIFTQKQNYIITCLMIEDDIDGFFDKSKVEKKGFHFAHMFPR